ncbi:metallo-beta-lactamase [Actibacterium mucosum KCTC 23349]|uniref:Metallo-beta-lactamase n=1 Tax=Actibacterium mucosum KCTC 23349 TaxID=1454373 RepID=A0A037ZKP1_9RHOB|nr:MBL fold metallo-hydrolase [Actibacterium mucosum]KAJ56122.1 metallo-beta-lactamase [Actibacterium mucosum KCTC 23349]
MDGAPNGIRYPWNDPPAEGGATEVAPGILWLRVPLPMALNHVNVYALDDGDGWTIIDTGLDTRRTRALWQSLLETGPLKGKPIRRVVVTHHHPDHVGLAGWFQAEMGAELLMPRTAWLMARMLVLDEQALPAPQAIDFYRQAGMDADRLKERAENRPYNFADTVAPLPLGYTRLDEGGTLQAAGRVWDIRFGDGHAPDHATFWSRDGDVVIGGDQLLPSISPNLGVYPTEPMADPVAEWLDSCTRLLPYATDAQLVLPGHKLPFTGLPARLQMLIDNHHGALKRLRGFLQTPATAVDCFPTLYKRTIGDGEYGLALVEAVGHLNHLWHLGLVTRQLREDGAWLWQVKGSESDDKENGLDPAD